MHLYICIYIYIYIMQGNLTLEKHVDTLELKSSRVYEWGDHGFCEKFTPKGVFSKYIPVAKRNAGDSATT